MPGTAHVTDLNLAGLIAACNNQGELRAVLIPAHLEQHERCGVRKIRCGVQREHEVILVADAPGIERLRIADAFADRVVFRRSLQRSQHLEISARQVLRELEELCER